VEKLAPDLWRLPVLPNWGINAYLAGNLVTVPATEWLGRLSTNRG
jgi:hypothetical protein